jgi:hypothetical protein
MLFHIQLRSEPLRRLAPWESLPGCLHGIHRKVPGFYLQHFGKWGICVVIANPKWVKAVKGNKDDTKDSKWIGDLFRIGLVKSSFIPDKEIRILHELTHSDVFAYTDAFYNTFRPHSAPGWLSPAQFGTALTPSHAA